MLKRTSPAGLPKLTDKPRSSKHRRFTTPKAKILVAAVVACLLLVTGTLAQLGLLRRAAPRAMTSASASATATAAEVGCSPNPSFVPGNPAKEYIYSGGRLLATEEPTDRTYPDPCIDANGCRVPGCISPVGGAETTYDVVRDFSGTQNPAGTWSYGYQAGLYSAVVPLPATGDPHGLGAGTSTWYLPNPYSLPAVIHNATGATYNLNNVITIPTDVILVHPGSAGERGAVRWTAPRAATITIQGRFEGLDNRSTLRNVAITHNTSATLFSTDFSGYGTRHPFNLTRTVAAGDTIEFSVGQGSDNIFEGDSTGLAAVITMPSPPTPQVLTYNPVTDFSPSSNPAGVWTYGYRVSAGAPFGFLPANDDPHALGANIHTWYLPNPYNLPLIVRNNMGANFIGYGATWPPDMLNLHPGGSGEKSVLRWTAPASGAVTISGRFEGLNAPTPTTTDVTVIHNTATLLSGSINLNGSGNSTPISLSRTVATGDIIEFVVGYGNGDVQQDSTGLAATITLQR